MEKLHDKEHKNHGQSCQNTRWIPKGKVVQVKSNYTVRLSMSTKQRNPPNYFCMILFVPPLPANKNKTQPIRKLQPWNKWLTNLSQKQKTFRKITCTRTCQCQWEYKMIGYNRYQDLGRERVSISFGKPSITRSPSNSQAVKSLVSSLYSYFKTFRQWIYFPGRCSLHPRVN